MVSQFFKPTTYAPITFKQSTNVTPGKLGFTVPGITPKTTYNYVSSTKPINITKMPTLQISKYTIPTAVKLKTDPNKLIADVNNMLNTISKNVITTHIQAQDNILKATLKSTSSEAIKINDTLKTVLGTLTPGATNNQIKTNVNAILNLQTNLDKLTVASSAFSIAPQIKAISDSGRAAIAQVTNNMNTLLARFDSDTSALKSTEINTPQQKAHLNNLMAQLDSNKKILMDEGKSTITKLSELTKNNITELQNMNKERLKVMSAGSEVRADIAGEMLTPRSAPLLPIKIVKASETAYDILTMPKDFRTYVQERFGITPTEALSGVLATTKRSLDGKETMFQYAIKWSFADRANAVYPILAVAPRDTMILPSPWKPPIDYPPNRSVQPTVYVPPKPVKVQMDIGESNGGGSSGGRIITAKLDATNAYMKAHPEARAKDVPQQFQRPSSAD